MDLSLPANTDMAARPVATLHSWPGDSPQSTARAVDALRDAGFGAIVFQPQDVADRADGDWPERLGVALEAACKGDPALPVYVGENLVARAAWRLAVDTPDLRGRACRLEEIQGEDWVCGALQDEATRGVYRVDADDSGAPRVEALGEDPVGWSAGRVVAVRVGPTVLPVGAAVAPGACHWLAPNIFHCVAESTLGVLESRLGEYLHGGGLAGVLFQIPEVDPACEGCIAWSDDLPERFEKRWARALDPLLPLLWLDGADAPAFRRQFRMVLSEAFEEILLDPLRGWCEARGMRLGLVEPRQSLLSQVAQGMGSAGFLMESAGIPVAVCCESAGAALPLPVRQAVSIARQNGGDGAWYRGFFTSWRGAGPRQAACEARRALAAGVGVLSVEGAAAGISGDRKRRNGANLLHEAQPWWPAVRALNEEIGQLAELLSRAPRRVQAVVLAPTESLMALACLGPDNAGPPGDAEDAPFSAQDIEAAFVSTLTGLDALQVEYDIAEERALVEQGRTQANTLIVGEADYGVAIVPPAYSWREETVRLLRRFARRGGAVILVRPIARFVDFEAMPALTALADEFANVFAVDRAGRDAAYQARRLWPPTLQVRETGDANTSDLIVQHRADEMHDLFLVVNASAQQDLQMQFQAELEGAVRLAGPGPDFAGIVYAEEKRGVQTFEMPLAPGAAALIAVGGDSDLSEPGAAILPRATSSAPLGAAWEFQRVDPNMAPLRLAAWATAAGRSNVPRPIDLLRAEFLNGEGEQSPTGADIELRFPFRSRLSAAPGVLWLALESPGDASVEVNGRVLEAAWGACPLFCDVAVADIADCLREGDNEVLVRCKKRLEAIEAPILLGDFAVAIDEQGAVELVDETTQLHNGNWADQGYPFYGGRMACTQRFTYAREKDRRVFLRIERPAGMVLEACIGEHRPLAVGDAPHRAEITRQLIEGENALRIVLASTLWNLLGPTHVAARVADVGQASPRLYDTWVAENRRFLERAPRLRPFGLSGGVYIDEYDPAAAKKPTEPSCDSG